MRDFEYRGHSTKQVHLHCQGSWGTARPTHARKKIEKKEEKKIYKGREKRRLSVHARELLKLEAERKGR